MQGIMAAATSQVQESTRLTCKLCQVALNRHWLSFKGICVFKCEWMAFVDKVRGRSTDLGTAWCWLVKQGNQCQNWAKESCKNPPNLFKLRLGSATPGNAGSWVYS